MADVDPFVAAVLGGAVGGVLVAVVDSILNRAREHERWLRDQRQRTYAEYLDLAQSAYEAHNDVWVAAQSEEPDRRVRMEMPGLMGLARELSAAARRIEVIASPTMRERALRIRMTHAAFGVAVDDYVSGLTVHEGGDPMDDLAEYQLDEAEVRDFAEAARRELGAGQDVRHRLGRWYRWRVAKRRYRRRPR